MGRFEKIFNNVWNDFGNKLTADKIWKDHYLKSNYSFIFKIF